MSRYISGEPMYQCRESFCKIWFSDREGIKTKIGESKISTHIGCPKCEHLLISRVQVRHGAIHTKEILGLPVAYSEVLANLITRLPKQHD